MGFSNAAKGSSISDKQAEKMLQAYQKKVKEDRSVDGSAAVNTNADDEDVGIEEETKENAMENRLMEDFINANHNNASKISLDYKLFDVVTAKNPSQVLRYSQQ